MLKTWSIKLKTNFRNIHSIQFYIFLSIILSLLYAVWKASIEHFFWYDEAVQFFDSKGAAYYNYYKELDLYLGLNQVFYKNIRFNMDPGGFTFLLH